MADDIKFGIKITADGAGVAPEARRVEDALRGIGDQARASAEEIQHATMIGAALGIVIGELGTQAVHKLMGMAGAALNAADAMNDLHLRTGESLRDLAAYDLLARQSGSSIEGVAHGIRQLSRYMVEHGDKLASIGVTATSSHEAMRQFADVIAGIQDPALRTALAIEVLGRNGTALLPMLVEGAAGMDEAASKTAAYGAAMEATAPLADMFNDQLAEMKIRAETVGLNITQAVLPSLINLNEYLGASSGKVGEFSLVSETARVVMQTLAIVAANVAFVFRAIGTEIGGIGAQMAALARGDFKGFGVIRDEMVADAKAARAALDEFEQKVLSGTVATKDATKADDDRTQALERSVRVLLAGKKAAKEHRDEMDMAARFHKQAEKELEALAKAREKAAQEEARSYEAAIHAGGEYLRGLDAQARAAEEAVDNFGKKRSAIEAATAAEIEEAVAIAALNGATEEQVAFLTEAAAAHRRLAAALGSHEVLEANRKAAEDAARDWQRITDDVNKALADAIFDGGKSAGELLKRYFRTLVLTPLIQGATAPITNAIGSALGFSTGGVGALGALGGGAGNYLSGANTLYNAYTGGTTSMLASGIGYVGSALGSTTMTGFAAGMQGSSLAAGLAGPTTAGAGGAMGAGAAFASAVPYIAAAVAILSMMDWGGGTPHQGAVAFAGENGANSPRTYAEMQAYYVNPADANQFDEKDFSKRYQADVGKALIPVAQGFADTFNAIAKEYGAGGGYTVGLGFSSDNDSKSRGRFSVIDSAGVELVDFLKRFNHDPQQGLEQFAEEGLRGLLRGLREVDLGSEINGFLKSSRIGGADRIDSLSTGQVTTMLQMMQGGVMDDFIRQLNLVGASFETVTSALARSGPGFLALEQHLKDLQAAIHATLDSSRRQIELGGLDAGGTYDYWDKEARKSVDLLSVAATSEDVQKYLAQANEATMAGWQTLDATQMADQRGAFLARLDDIEAKANSRDQAIRDTWAESQKIAGQSIAAAIDPAAQTMSEAAQAMLAAASAMQVAASTPQVVQVTGTAAAEVGGW